MDTLRDRISNVVRARRAAFGSLFTLGVKAGGSLLTITIFTIAARSMSADAFGQLVVWFNAMSLLAITATLGQETLISRNWGEYFGREDYGLARGAYRFGWRTTLLSAATFALLLILIAPHAPLAIDRTTLHAAAAFLFMQSCVHYSSHSSRVLSGVFVSETNREIVWRLVLLVAVGAGAYRQSLTPALFFGAAAFGMVIAVASQSIAVRKVFLALPAATPSEADRRAWMARAGLMWLSAMLESLSQYADVMLIGYFAAPAIAGDYFVIARIANIFQMIGSGLNNYVFSHVSTLYFSGQIAKLQEVLRSVISVASAFLLPALLFVVLFGALVLTLFGARHAADYPALIVLTVAGFAVALCGPAPVILLMTGRERLYSKTIALAVAARIVLTPLLAVNFGVLGAATAWAAVNAPLNIGLVLLCRKFCGLDPSVASLIAGVRQSLGLSGRSSQEEQRRVSSDA